MNNCDHKDTKKIMKLVSWAEDTASGDFDNTKGKHDQGFVKKLCCAECGAVVTQPKEQP